MNNKGKHIRMNTTNIIKIICIICILLSLIYILYYVFEIFKTNKSNKELDNINIVSNNTFTSESETMKKLKIINKENPDVIAWISIENTKVDYPVSQTNDNKYYLTHNYKKEDSISGSIFLDKNVDINKPSSNFLIYGHRNINGEMFETLANYKDEDYYKKHTEINFYTLYEESKYEIIYVFLSKVYYKKDINVFRYYNFINATNQDEYDEFINNCKKSELYDIGKSANYGEQLITLSTCEYSQVDGRLVIVAKKINI